MLGLAASHLSLMDGGADFTRQAITHRVTAMQLINESLGRPAASQAEGDARFATMMALVFQSSYMADGMLEFISMIRGCGIVEKTGMIGGLDGSLFREFSQEAHVATVLRVTAKQLDKPQDPELVEVFLTSLRRLGPLCASTVELEYLAAIERTVKLAKSSSLEGKRNS